MKIRDMIRFTSKGQKSQRLLGVVVEIKELPESGTCFLVRQISKTSGLINWVGKTHWVSERLGNLDSVENYGPLEKFDETIAWMDEVMQQS